MGMGQMNADFDAAIFFILFFFFLGIGGFNLLLLTKIGLEDYMNAE